jgi:hypothetical protein
LICHAAPHGAQTIEAMAHYSHCLNIGDELCPFPTR